MLFGRRQGHAVAFNKTYDPTESGHYDEPVDYVGALSDDGQVIGGIWSLSEGDGTFEMRREAEHEEDVAIEIAEAVPVPVGDR